VNLTEAFQLVVLLWQNKNAITAILVHT